MQYNNKTAYYFVQQAVGRRWGRWLRNIGDRVHVRSVTDSCLRLHGLQHQLPLLGVFLVLNNLVFVAMGRVFEALFLSLLEER